MYLIRDDEIGDAYFMGKDCKMQQLLFPLSTGILYL
jgi:hypothetical protein